MLHCSVTTFHKDHAENIYVVVSGAKTFTLLPPTDVWRMALHLYPAARYEQQVRGDCIDLCLWHSQPLCTTQCAASCSRALVHVLPLPCAAITMCCMLPLHSPLPPHNLDMCQQVQEVSLRVLLCFVATCAAPYLR